MFDFDIIFLIFLGSSDVVIVTTDKTSKFDQLHSVRYKLEHNQLSRLKPESDKINVFQTLDKHIKCSKDWEVKQFAVQLIHVSAHHMSSPILKQRILDYLFFLFFSSWKRYLGIFNLFIQVFFCPSIMFSGVFQSIIPQLFVDFPFSTGNLFWTNKKFVFFFNWEKSTNNC